jgi:phospholipid/cholesterol/gamma-HCH transport system substrate-binding protein
MATDYHKSELRAGVFVLLAVAVLVGMVFSVTGLPSGKRNTWFTEMEQVRFLKPASAVTFAGHPVGDIRRIEPVPDVGRVRVELSVDAALEVRDDAMLTLKQDGLLGDKYLELHPGTKGRPLHAPDKPIRARVPAGLDELSEGLDRFLAQFGPQLNDLIKKLDGILGGVQQVLGDPGTKRLQEIIEGIAKLVNDFNKEKLPEEFGRLTDRLLELTKALDGTVAQFDAIARENREGLKQVVGNAIVLTDQANAVVSENQANLQLTIRGLREVSHHLEQVSRKVRAQPSVLLFGGPEPLEDRRARDETELRREGRVGRYDKEVR